jgi:hypothetical protein
MIVKDPDMRTFTTLDYKFKEANNEKDSGCSGNPDIGALLDFCLRW